LRETEKIALKKTRGVVVGDEMRETREIGYIKLIKGLDDANQPHKQMPHHSGKVRVPCFRSK
jgi:hypothetical protein